MDRETLHALRERLTEIDAEIIERIAERQAIVSRIGRTKMASGKPTRDFRREREVFERDLAVAREQEVDEEVVRRVISELIEYSLTHQEQRRAAAQGEGAGREALVIGGAGKMGRWFAEFIENQGYDVTVADPNAEESRFPTHADWQNLELDAFDLIVVSTPIRVTAAILTQLAERTPRGVVMDLASVKDPLRRAFAALKEAGCRRVSIHPMFGPSTNLLAGRHVVHVDLGCSEGNALTEALFRPTMATMVRMTPEEHDRQIAWLLGLSHALNITFFEALTRSGLPADRLAEASSTTFERQLAIARDVAGESPALYYEIQRENPYQPAVFEVLSETVAAIEKAVRDEDAEGFEEMMLRGRDYLQTHANEAARQTADQE